MSKKLGEKFGQIDLHKAPKKSSLGETLGSFAVVIIVVTVLVNVFG